MRAILFLLIGVLIYLQWVLWFGKGGIRDVRGMQEQVLAQAAEISTLKERNLALAAEVTDLKDGLEAIEERARSEIGMVKKGEIFFQIIEPDESTDVTADASTDGRADGTGNTNSNAEIGAKLSAEGANE